MDLGKQNDYSAWSIVETLVVPTGRVETVQEPGMIAALANRRPGTYTRPEVEMQHRLRHLERTRGQPYPVVVARTKSILEQLNGLALLEAPAPADPYIQQTTRPPVPTLAVDATGVGQPVLDLLKAANLPCWTRGVVITSGDAVSRDGADFRVPKRDLASAIAVVLESGRLKWPAKLSLREVLERELKAFQVKVNASGHESYGAAGPGDGWRERPHDDLVLSVAMAVWVAEFAPGAAVTWSV